MRFATRLFIALFLFVGTICAQDPPKLSTAQQEVLQVRNALRDTALRRDMEAWSKFVADDCIFSSEDGILSTKAQLIEHNKSMPPEYDHSVNPRDYVVHVYGNTAVVNFLLTVHEQFNNSDIISEMRQTETYVKQDGSWMLVARQWGKLPVNFRKPVVVDTTAYKDYVGQYEWRPHGDVDIVSVKDGKLWSQFDSDKDEYQPLGAETFFVKSDLGSITFTRDPQGHVTGYTYHRDDGQEIHVKKIQ